MRQPRMAHARTATFLACAAPLALSLWRLHAGSLGADPIAALIHASGWWAYAMLAACLSVTPLRWVGRRVAVAATIHFGRRLSDWNGLIRLRRQLGLWCFFYATLHAALHTLFDAGSLGEVLREATERRFVGWGLAALALLLPLALTSTQAWMRRLKRHWARLHKLVYAAALAALVHAWLQTKHGHEPPWGFGVVLVVLLGARLLAWLAGQRAPAREEAERPRDRA